LIDRSIAELSSAGCVIAVGARGRASVRAALRAAAQAQAAREALTHRGIAIDRPNAIDCAHIEGEPKKSAVS
jgi:hypothetical protein